MTRSDTRLLRSTVEHLSDDEYFWTLMEPAWDEQSRGTLGQRILATTTYFIRDVGNGGLEQALWNFDPAEVKFVINCLDLLGATRHAAVLRAGLLTLLGDSPPSTLEERRTIIDALTREWLDEHVEPLNEQLYDEESLWPYYRKYIEQHPVEFFRE
jgi:Domain of unknown function (DUF4375)